MFSLYEFKIMPSFHNEFQHKPDFPLHTASDRKHLNINNLSASDSAFYYCTRKNLFDVEFSDAVFVSATLQVGLSHHRVITQQLKVSTRLVHCTVRSCGEQHSAFWFRDPGEPPLGFSYTLRRNNGQWESNNDAQTLPCVYYQPTKSLNVSPFGLTTVLTPLVDTQC